MNQVNGYDQDPMHIHDNKPPFLFWNQYYPNFYVKKLLKIVNNQQFEKSNTIDPNLTDTLRQSKSFQYTGPAWENADLRLIFLETLDIITWANSIYNFDINMKEHQVQLTKYSDCGSYYSWHSDSEFDFRNDSPSFNKRKLSCTIVLQEADEGGILETKYGTEGFNQRAGSILVFPSHYSHQVTPVLKGERISIVSWTSGPEWK